MSFYGYVIPSIEAAPSAYEHDRDPGETEKILSELHDDFIVGTAADPDANKLDGWPEW